MKPNLSILLLTMLASCKEDSIPIINLNGNRITAMGHGGMGIYSNYPMNSFESIVNCLSLGMDGTELDVQMTRDSVLVAFHDEDLADDTRLSGKVHSHHWSALEDARYTETPFLNYSVISMDELFSNIEDLQNYQFTFHCKLYTDDDDPIPYYESYIRAVRRLIQKFGMEQKVYMESESLDFLRLFKHQDPDSRLFIYPTSFESGLDIALHMALYGITISTRHISREQVQIAHDHHLRVALWEVESESDNFEAIHKNPDFIQTDQVRHLRELLK